MAVQRHGQGFLGEPEVAIERAARAMRLSPQDPQMFGMQVATAWAHFFAGRYEEALSWAQTAVREQPNFFIALCVAAASAALGGKPDEAREAMARVRQLNPALRMSNLDEILPFSAGRISTCGRRGCEKPACRNSEDLRLFPFFLAELL